MEALIRDRVERFMANGNFVGRDEFDAVKEMAATARAEQERLAMRVEKLEQMLAKSASRAPRRTGKKGAT
jgi:BMFP domain-containing protein YqiC